MFKKLGKKGAFEASLLAIGFRIEGLGGIIGLGNFQEIPPRSNDPQRGFMKVLCTTAATSCGTCKGGMTKALSKASGNKKLLRKYVLIVTISAWLLLVLKRGIL